MPTDWTTTQIASKIEILENIKRQLEKDYRFKIIEINNQIEHLQKSISNESVMQSNEWHINASVLTNPNMDAIQRRDEFMEKMEKKVTGVQLNPDGTWTATYSK